MLRMLKVFPANEKFLRTVSAPVALEPLVTEDGSEQFVLSAELTDLATDMIETMQAHRAAGLSAVQIGEHQRIITFVRESGDVQVLINPEIVDNEGEVIDSTEGCLSFPSVFEVITKTRSMETIARGVDITGTMVTLALSGQEAVAVQHEIDHLNGVLFTDHMSAIKRRYAIKRITKVNKRMEIFRKSQTQAARTR